MSDQIDYSKRQIAHEVRFERAGVRIILASASPYRRALLENAGLSIDVRPAKVDEDAIKYALTSTGDCQPGDVAELLARTKALTVSDDEAGSIVIGADQVMAFKDQIYSKPKSIEEARETLLQLRGNTHQLISAVSIARSGKELWTYSETAHMTMRRFSPEWLGTYLARAGDDVMNTVGGYAYEGIGIQLFERIDGDYFTVIGLPMLPLLQTLRDQGAIG